MPRTLRRLHANAKRRTGRSSPSTGPSTDPSTGPSTGPSASQTQGTPHRAGQGRLKLSREAAIMTGNRQREAPLSDAEPIEFSPRRHAGYAGAHAPTPYASTTSFNRKELKEILNLYGRKVALGEWRDYAIDFQRDRAVFSVYRRASEVPLYRIEKQPRLARKQGAYSVVAASGLILKRGNELNRVLESLDNRVRLAAI
jgi:hypothetical protein